MLYKRKANFILINILRFYPIAEISEDLLSNIYKFYLLLADLLPENIFICGKGYYVHNTQF